MLARAIFAMVRFGARKGLSDAASEDDATGGRRNTGVRGETYAYWYLRRQGYVMIARNYRTRGDRGELDLVGYDGETVAFVEVKTKTMRGDDDIRPEANITEGKWRATSRIAHLFLRERHLQKQPYRFDVLAIENRVGTAPVVRLHKGAFAG